MESDTAEFAAMSHGELVKVILQMKEEFNDYMGESKLMEKYMEEEVEDLKKKVRDADQRNQKAIGDVERIQQRQLSERSEWTRIEECLRKENAALKEQCEKSKVRIRELEQSNDNLERAERNFQQLVADLEAKWNVAVEKVALLENELFERQSTAEEMFRLREELKSERPLLVVGPLRVEKLDDAPEEPTPTDQADAKKGGLDVEMEDAAPLRLPTPLDAPMEPAEDDHSAPETPTNSQKGLSGRVNRIVKDLMTKVDRLEHILSGMRVHTQPRPAAAIA